jgi:hypothetical protein
VVFFFFLFLSCQDDKDLVHEFVVAEGLTCLIKVGAEADQNYQNYILRGKSKPGMPLPGLSCRNLDTENFVRGLNSVVGWQSHLVAKAAFFNKVYQGLVNS